MEALPSDHLRNHILLLLLFLGRLVLFLIAICDSSSQLHQSLLRVLIQVDLIGQETSTLFLEALPLLILLLTGGWPKANRRHQ